MKTLATNYNRSCELRGGVAATSSGFGMVCCPPMVMPPLYEFLPNASQDIWENVNSFMNIHEQCSSM